jgi:hypothetical protein
VIKKSLFAVGAFLAIAGIASAAERVPAENTRSGAEVAIPARAVEVTPGVFSLGSAVDPESGELVEGYAFVHKPRVAQAKPETGAAKGKPTQCYGYLASGAKWKSVEPWLVNTANSRGLDGATVFALASASAAKWNGAAGVAVLGASAPTVDALSAETAAPDGLNEAYFGSVSSSGAIAVTTVWGIFSGPAAGRKLVEWDQVYDQVDYDWSTDGSAGKMDFESLATHELGHSVGMGDLYTSSCAEQTMYGYATEGETKKRSLESGDIAGASSLY